MEGLLFDSFIFKNIKKVLILRGYLLLKIFAAQDRLRLINSINGNLIVIRITIVRVD